MLVWQYKNLPLLLLLFDEYSKATPLTGEAMVLQCNDAGSWKMTLSIVASCPVSHVGGAQPVRAGLPPGKSGLSGVRAGCLLFVCHRRRSQMCQSINDWCLPPSGPDSPLSPACRPRSCRPSAAIDAPLRTKIGAELPQSCCSFIYLFIVLESPGTEIQLASSPLWVMCPCCIYSPLFVFLLQIRRRFWREEILVLPHLCLLCLCIWVRALIQ